MRHGQWTAAGVREKGPREVGSFLAIGLGEVLIGDNARLVDTELP